MNKRIFRGISLTALAVLLLSMVVIFGALYGYFDNLQASRLRTETALAAQGVRLSGRAYFEDLEPGDYRLTWVAEDGRVLADTERDPATMENHASRQEIAQALKNGYGESRRYSDTRMEKTLYYALRLEDGSVVRLSVATSTVLNLVLGMAQPICLVLAGALVLSLFLAGRISKKIVAPLNALDLEHPLDNVGYDELSSLLRRLDVQQQQIRSRTSELKRRQTALYAVTLSHIFSWFQKITSLRVPIAKYVYIEVMGMFYYAKYHKDGNSFIIVDKQDIRGEDKRLLAQTLCRQDTNIGADSLIICDTSQHHISMVSYSRNGMRQPLNGNGIACLIQYCYEYGFLLEREAYIKTDAALVGVKIKKTSPFTTAVYLPPAIFSAESCCIPESVYTEEIYIDIGYGRVPLTTVNTGNIYFNIFLQIFFKKPSDKISQSPLDSFCSALAAGKR